MFSFSNTQDSSDAHQGEIPGAPRADLAIGTAHLAGQGRELDLRHDFIGLQDVLLEDAFVGPDKKVGNADGLVSRRPGNQQLCLQGAQRHGGVGRMHEKARAAPENRMVLVFSFHGIAEVSALARAAEVAAEIPAARPLADIAADGSLVAQLRAADLERGLCQHRVFFRDRAVGGYFGNRRERADP